MTIVIFFVWKERKEAADDRTDHFDVVWHGISVTCTGRCCVCVGISYDGNLYWSVKFEDSLSDAANTAMGMASPLSWGAGVIHLCCCGMLQYA